MSRTSSCNTRLKNEASIVFTDHVPLVTPADSISVHHLWLTSTDCAQNVVLMYILDVIVTKTTFPSQEHKIFIDKHACAIYQVFVHPREKKY